MPSLSLPAMLERRLGTPEYQRIWAVADDYPLNEYRSIAFCGWPVGWGEDISEGGSRVDVEIHVTSDGKFVVAVEVDARPTRAFASSPPDRWTTFLAECDSLVGAAGWLRDLQRVYAPEAGWPPVAAALAQARAATAETAGEPVTPG